MKKIFVSMLVATTLFATAQAQTERAVSNTPTTDAKVMTQEEKDAAKAKKEALLAEAFAKAGVAADVQEKAKAMLKAYNEKAKAVKGNADITEDAKKSQLEAIYKDKDEQLKSILGDDKYKIFKDTQKAQKEAAKAAAQ